jgi:hypothetical protein
MLKYHLGKRDYVEDQERPYIGFVKNFHTLKRLAELSASNRELDRYLWLAGQYREWRRNPQAL